MEGERQRERDNDRLRKSASKYDYVKVNVWLSGEAGGAGHHYVLSRYLTSRMLTVTKIRQMKAVQIALELKKQLVDSNRLDISQEELERTLFGIMEARGFGGEYVTRYRMVTRFFQQRRPLIILICGVHCSGKSTVAQALASRLNLPNVLQTDIIHELLQGPGQPAAAPLHARFSLEDEDLVGEFQKEARLIRKAVTGDLVKTIRDGKPIIIEGMHLDPGLYLYEFGRHGMGHLAPLLQRAPSTLLPHEQLLAAAASVSGPGSAAAEAAGPPEPAAAEPAAAAEPSAAHEAAGGRAGHEGQPGVGGGRSFRKTASFALSFAGDGLRPRITSLTPEPAQPAAPAEAVAATVGSPGWQWLQQLQLSEEAAPAEGRERGASRRQRTSAWLSRHSRRLLGLSPRAPRQPAEQPQQEAVPPASTAVDAEPPRPHEEASSGGEARDSSGEEMRVPGSVFAATGSRSGAGSPRALRREGVGATSLGAQASLAIRLSESQSSEEEDAPCSAASPAEAMTLEQGGASGGGGGGGGEPGPVFVPIVLCMDDPDHGMLVRQWCRHQGLGDDEATIARVRHRLQLLQAYLASYAACDVPVIHTSLTDLTATTDLLHEYLLECIAIQMDCE